MNCHTKKGQNVQKKIDILNFSKSLEHEARSLKLRKDKAGAVNWVRFPCYLHNSGKEEMSPGLDTLYSLLITKVLKFFGMMGKIRN